jgi:chemotaxis protein methyltransferase CheR
MTALGHELPSDVDGAGGWSDAAFGRIADWLHAEAGLVFPVVRRATVEAALRRVMAAARIREPEGLRAALQLGGPIVDAVIGELTIGETYFFREPRQLDVVRQLAFPGPEHASRPFRAWSAGCASGEEPYTLAIMLREAQPAQPARVVGTDLASSRLAAARRGRYTRWSFRGVSDQVVRRYFSTERQYFVLDPSIRAAVDFRLLNLAEDAYPSSATGIQAMDLILCRNVLIYFDAETVRRVATRLLASLSDDGWLFLGASDPMIGGVVECETVVTDAGLAYRRARQPSRTTASQSTAPAGNDAVTLDLSSGSNVRVGDVPAPPRERADAPSWPASPSPLAPVQTESVHPAESVPDVAATLAAYAAGDFDASAALAARVVAVAPSEAVSVVLVRSLANRGRLAEAESACVLALEQYAGSAELEYLRGLLLDEAGHGAAARTAVRRALYLDRRLTVAHLLFGELLARAGDRAGAERAFRNAEALLAPLPSDATVPGADGAPAARLLHIARTRAVAMAGAVR